MKKSRQSEKQAVVNTNFSAKHEENADEYLFKKCKEYGFNPDGTSGLSVHLAACADLPSRFGDFIITAFYDEESGQEHSAVIHGNVSGSERCPVRIHSKCHTGDVLGSLRCDCGLQLEASMDYIASQPRGVLIYLDQEGRGIGLVNKIKAYNLQDMGFDTVDANTLLGFPEDARDYRVASEIIRILNIRSVDIITNNPEKIEALRKGGIEVVKRIPVITEKNNHNRSYLNTKKHRMGHLL